MTLGKNQLSATILLVSTLAPQLSQAAFVTYTGSGTLNGRDISMTLEIDNEFELWLSGPWHPPEYFDSIGYHPNDVPLGAFAVGDYSITLEGAGTTSNTGREMIFYWNTGINHFEFFNDETILNTDETQSGVFAHNHVDFLDGNGNTYDWSNWESGHFELAPEIAFTRLNLMSWDGATIGPEEINLHLHPVPIPAAIWLFGTGLLGLLGLTRRK